MQLSIVCLSGLNVWIKLWNFLAKKDEKHKKEDWVFIFSGVKETN
jgi:hypothetical protein